MVAPRRAPARWRGLLFRQPSRLGTTVTAPIRDEMLLSARLDVGRKADATVGSDADSHRGDPLTFRNFGSSRFMRSPSVPPGLATRSQPSRTGCSGERV